jgi:hypothetical protein
LNKKERRLKRDPIKSGPWEKYYLVGGIVYSSNKIKRLRKIAKEKFAQFYQN